jgi:hypothetical protein
VCIVCVNNTASKVVETVVRQLAADGGVESRDGPGYALNLRVSSRLLGGGNPIWHHSGSWDNVGLEGRSLHHGRPPDAELAAAAAERGYELVGVSRPLVREDLDESHVVIAIGDQAMPLLSSAALAWGGEELRARTEMLSRVVPSHSIPSVDTWKRGVRGDADRNTAARQLVCEAEILSHELMPFLRQRHCEVTSESCINRED